MTTNVKPDFRKIFQGLPGRQLILTPDLVIVAATNAYYAITRTQPKGIVGHYVFDVFPENTDTKQAKGGSNLSASFKKVLGTKLPNVIPLQRYDFPLPTSEGGGFAAAWWRITNSPILDADGKIVYIVNTVEDVTHMVDVLGDAMDKAKNLE